MKIILLLSPLFLLSCDNTPNYSPPPSQAQQPVNIEIDLDDYHKKPKQTVVHHHHTKTVIVEKVVPPQKKFTPVAPLPKPSSSYSRPSTTSTSRK